MMTFKLIRKPLVAALAGLTVISWMIADSQTSDAQLFRRLRNRIQYRTPPPQVPNNQNQPQFQPNVPQYNQQLPYDPNNPNNGLDPRRVAPVNPAEPRKFGAAGTDTDPRLAPTISAKSRRTSRDNQAPNANQNSFGSSILPKSNANTADAGQRKPAVGGATEKMELAQRKRASLGIQVVASRRGTPGLLVTGINPDSQALSAGLKVGDLIVSIDGQPTGSVSEIAKQLSGRNGGDNVQVRFVRDRSTSSISVPLMGNQLMGNQPTDDAIASTPKPESKKPGLLGLRYANVEGQRGALITAVQADSPASTSGLKTGDRIVAINGRLLISAEALQQTLNHRKDDAEIGVRMVRAGKLMSAKIDPLAKPTATDSLATTENGSAGGNQKSVLGGLGAIFGGLLNGKSKPKQPKDEMALVDEMELGDEPEVVDEMDLGDGEGVQQVGFESELDTEDLLPQQQAKKKSSEELQKEIDDLRKQIEVFQKKK